MAQQKITPNTIDQPLNKGTKMNNPVALINGKIETVTKGVIEKGGVVFRGEKITAVGKKVTVPKNAEVIDCKGKTITPGLIDAHCHAGLEENGFSADRDYNESSDPCTPQVRAIDAFKKDDSTLLTAAKAGVTTFWMTPGSANVIGGLGAVVKTFGLSYADYIVKEEEGMKFALGENPKRVYGQGRDKMPKTRMGIFALLRQELTKAKEYMNDKKRTETDLGMENLVRVLKRKLKVRCHAHKNSDMISFMRIAEEFDLDFTFEHATDSRSIIHELAEKNIPLMLGPTMTNITKREVFSRSFGTAKVVAENNIPFCIISDSSFNPLEYLTTYAGLAVCEGLSETDALKAITINPAIILGIDKELGSIEKGKKADLVIWPGDPLDCRVAPEKVFVNGIGVE